MSLVTPNPLFRSGTHKHLNACVGSNGGPHDFGSYADGFFYSAFYTIEAAARGEWAIDLLVYPICFNLRHGIELYVKHLVILGARFLDDTSIKFKPNHSLTENWLAWSKLASRLPPGAIDQGDFTLAKTLIDHFVAIDSSNQTFRYPEDVKKNLHLLGVSVINIEVLDTEMRKIHDAFESWDSALIGLLEYANKSTSSVELPA